VRQGLPPRITDLVVLNRLALRLRQAAREAALPARAQGRGHQTPRATQIRDRAGQATAGGDLPRAPVHGDQEAW